MAWERRGDRNENRYYTQRTTCGGVPVRLYYGYGEAAEAQARRDNQRRSEEVARRARHLAQVRRWDSAAEALDTLSLSVTQALRRALAGAGYHQHKRGEWRRWRKRMETTPNETGAAQETAQEMIVRARRGDVDTLPTLRAVLDHRPDEARAAGDLARQAEDALLSQLCGQDLVHRECVRRWLDGERRALAGESLSPLEGLLVERVTLARLHLHSLEAADTQGLRLTDLEAHERRVDRAQARFFAAVRALATARRLLTPVTIHAGQVNVGAQQINVARTEVPAARGEG